MQHGHTPPYIKASCSVEECVQQERGTPLVQKRVCSMDWSHSQHGGGIIISLYEGVQC